MEREMDPAADALSAMQIVAIAVAGIVLWYAAAVLLRTIGSMGGFAGTNRMWLYVATIPGTLPFILAIVRLVRLGTAQIVPAVALATATALLCDGIAVAWFPGLYGASAEAVRDAAGAVLWGAGVGIFIGFALVARRRAAR